MTNPFTLHVFNHTCDMFQNTSYHALPLLSWKARQKHHWPRRKNGKGTWVLCLSGGKAPRGEEEPNEGDEVEEVVGGEEGQGRRIRSKNLGDSAASLVVFLFCGYRNGLLETCATRMARNHRVDFGCQN